MAKEGLEGGGGGGSSSRADGGDGGRDSDRGGARGAFSTELYYITLLHSFIVFTFSTYISLIYRFAMFP